MRILHINTYQTGGAALCMLRIGRALQKQGVECRYLTMNGDNNKYTTVAVGDTNIWSKNKIVYFFQQTLFLLGIKPKYIKLRQRLKNAQSKNKEHIFATLPLSFYRSLSSHPWVKEAEIIHVHWIGNFVDFPTFFKNINKPIVWTLHDLNPILGCIHYLALDHKIPSLLNNLEKECSKIKQHSLCNIKNINVVAISKQMRKAISTSKSLGKYNITLINNGVDTEKFIPHDRKAMRREFNIPSEAIVLIFSSQSLDDPRKGFKELTIALESLNIQNLFLLCIGHYKQTPQASFPIMCTGFISDETILSKYYSSADYLVMPSFQEGFAQTSLEAMSCGVPVIAFPCSGTDDLINEKNGIICNDFSIKSLAEGILKAINNKYNYYSIREDIIKRFSYDNIAKQYINLYKTILQNNNLPETNNEFSKLNYEIINQQRVEHKKQLDLFSQLDGRRDFYKMVLTHPRYIAGWIKRKIQRLFK